MKNTKSEAKEKLSSDNLTDKLIKEIQSIEKEEHFGYIDSPKELINIALTNLLVKFKDNTSNENKGLLFECLTDLALKYYDSLVNVNEFESNALIEVTEIE